MNTSRQASVVIPCFNERRHIEAVVKSVLGADRSSRVRELIVVDGMSNDGTRDVLNQMASEFSDLRLVDNPERDIPHAMNAGIRAARGEVIIRMDAHSIYSSDYADRLLTLLDDSADAGNVGGAWNVLPGGDTDVARAIAAVTSSRFGVGSALYRVGHGVTSDVDTVPFGCFPRAVLERVGMYDEDLVRNEDDELNARIRASGFRVILDPSIRIDYFCRETFGKIARMFFQYGYFKPLVCLKTRTLTSIRQLVPPTLVLAIAGFTLASAWLPEMLWATALLLAIYGLFVLSGSLAIVRQRLQFRTKMVILCSICIALVHASYGLGYLRGTLDFVILRRHRQRRLRAAVTR